jgi:hypothetical protein
VQGLRSAGPPVNAGNPGVPAAPVALPAQLSLTYVTVARGRRQHRPLRYPDKSLDEILTYGPLKIKLTAPSGGVKRLCGTRNSKSSKRSGS